MKPDRIAARRSSITLAEPATASDDADLIERARAADPEAMEQLWRRHHSAAVRFAQGLVGPGDADDLVSEAFANIYQTLRNGGGPDALFRPYLFTSVKNLAIRWGVKESRLARDDVDPDELGVEADLPDASSALERSMIVQVFHALPARWQEVLWYTEVEQLKPQSIAPQLGLTANSVAALSHRAREGFRKAWIIAHSQIDPIPAACRRIVNETARRDAGTIPPRIARHLRTCPHCTSLTAQMDALPGRLRIVLLPLFLGATGAAVFARTFGTTSAAPVAAAPVATGGMATGMLASGVVVGAAIVASACLIAGLTLTPPAAPVVVAGIDPGKATERQPGSPSGPSTDPDGPSTDPDGPSSPDAPASTGTQPEAQRPEPPQAPPPPSGPAPVLASASPAVSTPATGAAVPSRFFTIAGTGTPGSTVIVDMGAPGQVVAPVLADGTWTAAGTAAVAEGWHDLLISQVTPGRGASAPVLVRVLVDETAPLVPVLTSPIPTGATSSPLLAGTAEPGAIVTLSRASAPDASVVAGPDGTWSFPASVQLSPLEPQVLLRQTDLAGNASPDQVVATQFAPSLELQTPSPVPAGDPIPFVVRGWSGADYRVYLDGVLLETSPGIQTYTIGAAGAAPVQVLLGAATGSHLLTVGYVDAGVAGPPAFFTSTPIDVIP